MDPVLPPEPAAAVHSRIPPAPRRAWLRELTAGLGLWTLVAIMFTGHNYLTFTADGRPISFLHALWWSIAEWYTWVLLTPVVVRAARRYRPAAGTLARSLLKLTAVGVLVATAQITLEYLSDHLAVFVSGDPSLTVAVWLSHGVRGAALDLGYFVPRKIGFSFVTYWAVVVAAMAFEYHRLFRERTVHAARLEAALASAQLQALQAQLQPHFLFNTLNTIASLIAEDPRAAEGVVESLGDLLRAALHDAGRREIALERELELLDQYLAIQETRFRGRLRVRRVLDPDANRAAVPPLMLQPLAENAIRHGIALRSSGGTLTVRTARVADGLELMIEDDGPGFDGAGEASHTAGVGLANTRARLERLYGVAGQLDVGNRSGGGAFARVRLPFTLSTEPALRARPVAREAVVVR
jgi:two-component system LytT family sensor kinase